MNQLTKVLLIEDNPADARLIGEMLREAEAKGLAFELAWADSLAAGAQRLHEGGIDVILLDLGLPESTGLDTLQRLLEHEPRAPTLVVLSGLTDEDVALQALKSGAEDYLVKGQVDSALLVRSIRYAIGRSQAEAALVAAKEKAEVASRAKSAFLAHMSHDLRTPLNGILGFAQILQRDEALSPAQVRAVDAIRRSGEHLLALISDILDLAKIEAGKFELMSDPFDLQDTLRVVVEIIRMRAADKPQVQLSCELAPDLPAAVRGDEQRLRQVLLNLLDNAVKFTPAGQVSLRARFIAPSRLHLEVQDSGIGMSAEECARLFQPFSQVGDAQQRRSGTGLGLVISQRFVRLMGGDIALHSEPGVGTRVSFEIDAPPVRVGSRAAN
jgi:signal transduction histidine kinase